MAKQKTPQTSVEVPTNYTLCIKGDCPRAAMCLRYKATQMMPAEVEKWSIVSLRIWHRWRASVPCTARPRRYCMPVALCG